MCRSPSIFLSVFPHSSSAPLPLLHSLGDRAFSHKRLPSQLPNEIPPPNSQYTHTHASLSVSLHIPPPLHRLNTPLFRDCTTGGSHSQLERGEKNPAGWEAPELCWLDNSWLARRSLVMGGFKYTHQNKIYIYKKRGEGVSVAVAESGGWSC